MKDLVIIGAGGFGRTIYWQCNADERNGREWTIKGFVDDRPRMLDGFPIPMPILGSPFDYVPGANELWLCALGEPQMRRKYAAPLIGRHATFTNLYTEVACPPSTMVGRGVIFERKVQIGSDSTIGDFVTILSLSVIGHDVSVGDYVQIGSFTFIGARARIGSDVQIHPHACILPGVSVGDRAVVGAGSVVTKNVPADTTVFGNPARVVFSR